MEQVTACINTFFPYIILMFGIIFTAFHGIGAVYIFIENKDGSVPKEYLKNKSWYWWVHQIWLNTLGQIVGWVVLYYLWKKGNEIGIDKFEIRDYIALIIAFLGVTGYLPSVLTRWQPKT